MQGMSGNIPLQARTKEFLCKPAEEQNPRLTTGLPPVYQRFITGTKSALRSWMPNNRSTPFCLCKPFSSQGCPGKHNVRRWKSYNGAPRGRSSISTPRSAKTGRRGGVRCSGMGWRRVDAPWTAAGRCAQEKIVHLAFQGTEDNRPGRLVGGTGKGNPM